MRKIKRRVSFKLDRKLIKFWELKNRLLSGLIYKDSGIQLLKWLSSLPKDKVETAKSRGLLELILFKLIHWCLLYISIVNCPKDLALLHHKYCVLHLENQQKKTNKIGKFLLAYLTGKIQKVTLFQFIWELEPKAEHYSITL